jgi:hypothetical protein
MNRLSFVGALSAALIVTGPHVASAVTCEELAQHARA